MDYVETIEDVLLVIGVLITIALIIFAVKILIIPGLILICLIFAGSFFTN